MGEIYKNFVDTLKNGDEAIFPCKNFGAHVSYAGCCLVKFSSSSSIEHIYIFTFVFY
jgi:hypothetical protein